MKQKIPRVVIVGFGPVAARLVDQLLPAVASGDLALTVLGAEPDPAYNRVLVADLAVGRTTVEAISLADSVLLLAAGVDVRLGVRVARVERPRSRVLLDDGGHVDYNWLVFATGAAAVIPTLSGLNPDPFAKVPLPAGVSALRDLNDASVLRAAVERRERVIVLGGGILGLETALAASDEGAVVTVVHSGSHLLGRSIDRAGSTVLAATLRSRGVRIACNSRSTRVELDGPGGSFSALRLDDGSTIEGELLVLSCGVRPRVELAQGAGLPTGRGILVDHGLNAHHDPQVFAIGDCAEVGCIDVDCPECQGVTGPSGLIGPGWRQADFVAEQLLGLADTASISDGWLAGTQPVPPARLPAENSSVILLKAIGVDLAAAGDVTADPWDEEPVSEGTAGARPPLRVSQWADPEHGRYVKMSTRAGVLEGLVCIGMPRTATELVLLFERGSELPADRSTLLRLDGPEQVLGQALGSTDPEVTVCRCAGVSRGEITAAVALGCSTVAEVSSTTRAGTGCGGCHDQIRELIEHHFQAAAA